MSVGKVSNPPTIGEYPDLAQKINELNDFRDHHKTDLNYHDI